jgi:transposase
MSVIDQTQQVKVRSTCKISNNAKGFRALEEWILRHHKQKGIPLVVCMEATGVYYENCAMYLQKAGFTVSVILPNLAKRYLQASGQKSKNDKIDAKGLAQMGAEKALRKWEPLGEFFYALRLLTRQVENLQGHRTVIKNQQHALGHGMYQSKMVNKALKDQVKLIDRQLGMLDQQIQKHMASNPKIAEKAAKICKVKGLGIYTVAVILAETNGFLLFENARQLSSFAGYDVIENQSGKHTGRTRISKKGNSHIRRALFMPAFNVVKYRVQPFFDLYLRTYEKHGIKMKSYVAVQKKLLSIIYALWKKDEEFIEGNKAEVQQQQQSRTVLDGQKILVPARPALNKVNRKSEISPYVSSET